MNREIDPSEARRRSTPALFHRSVLVILTNLIPLYGVWHYGWDSFIIILLFIVEAAAVFVTDLIKNRFGVPARYRPALFFEFIFMLFFGFFAILIFGRDENSSNLLETISSSFAAASILPLWPVVSIFIMRLARLGQELFEAGVLGGGMRRTLYYSGGGWMLLLFFLVMTAPFIADRGPNPLAGLVAVIVFKSVGELFAVWAERIAKGKKKAARHRSAP